MLWFLIWLALVVAAVAVLAYLGLRLYRQAKALTRELSTASEQLAEISARLAEAAPPPPPPGARAHRG